MKIQLPNGKYVSQITVEQDHLKVDFKKRQKIGLLLIGINERYWPYLAQVIRDCKQHFLPQHKVEYHIWSDITPDARKVWEAYQLETEALFTEYHQSKEKDAVVNKIGTRLISLFNRFDKTSGYGLQEGLARLGQDRIFLRRDEKAAWLETQPMPQDKMVTALTEVSSNIVTAVKGVIDEVLSHHVYETEPIEWPAPTLMRYHLFLQQEEKLNDYDYLFYLDADMRVVTKISDEILGEGLTAAEHPMYARRKEYLAPYEPNPKSAAYIPRVGNIVNENGKSRFVERYYAGGFQGGRTHLFMKAMRRMKKTIDRDFHNNYTAIWNDESHWNKYLYTNDDPLIVLGPEYVYPDSLIKEYYEPIWGRKIEPKIMTITKPFNLSSEGGAHVREFLTQQGKV